VEVSRWRKWVFGLWPKAKEFLWYYTGGLVKRLEENHAFLFAGGLAFSMFISTIPLVLIVFSVLGTTLQRPVVSDELRRIIDQIIPYKDYADFVKDLIFNRVRAFQQFKNLAGIVGIVGLLFAASSLFSSMRTILNTVYRVRKNVSVLLAKLRDFALVVVVIVYFLFSAIFLSVWQVSKELAAKLAFLSVLDVALVQRLLLSLASFCVMFIAFFVLYISIPYRRPPRSVVIVSAIAATVLWEVAKQAFGFYISNFITLQRIYGTYVLTVVVAFWIYYTSLVFIIGAEIGQLYRERKVVKHRATEMSSVASPR